MRARSRKAANAVKHQQEALRPYDRGDGGFEFAQALLDLGEVLRRGRHRIAARGTLLPTSRRLQP